MNRRLHCDPMVSRGSLFLRTSDISGCRDTFTCFYSSRLRHLTPYCGLDCEIIRMVFWNCFCRQHYFTTCIGTVYNISSGS